MGIRGVNAGRGGAQSRGFREESSAEYPRRIPSRGGRFRARWEDLCASAEMLGRWVALDNVAYEQGKREPSEVEVVDMDHDLAALCARMRAANQTACCVMQCASKVAPPVSKRVPRVAPPTPAEARVPSGIRRRPS